MEEDGEIKEEPEDVKAMERASLARPTGRGGRAKISARHGCLLSKISSRRI